MRKKRRISGLNIIKNTMIVFIAINVVLGGASQATLKNDNEMEENTLREDLNITGKAPIVFVEDEGAITDLNQTEDILECDLIKPTMVYEETTGMERENLTPQTPETISEESQTPKSENSNHLKIENITSNSTTTERIEAVFEYLITEGFTPESAAGVIGNIAVESCFDPNVVSESGYYGLFQWNTCEDGNYWWYDINNWLQENDYEWNSFEGQVRAFVECSNKGIMEDEMFSELKKLRNVEQATELVTVFYEACVGGDGQTFYYYKGSYYQDLNLRKEEAWVAYYMYLNGNEYNGNKPY